MLHLQNSIFSVDIDNQNGSFSIHPTGKEFPSLEKVRLGCVYRRRGQLFERLTTAWQAEIIQQGMINTTDHGEIDEVTIQVPDDEFGIGFRITIGIVQEYPLVIWKVKLLNHGSNPVELEKIDLLRIDPEFYGQIVYSKAKSKKELGFYSNGWQSWSPSGWYSAESRMNISRLGFLQHPMIYNPGTPLPRKHGEFSSDMFAVVGDRTARTGFLVGFLSQKNHFGSVLANFNIGSLEMWANGDEARVNPGCSIETDWAVFNPVLLDHRDPLGKYLEAVGRENRVRILDDVPVGWCSWYHYYTNLTAQDIEGNLQAILDMQERLPVQLVQIDDGFETEVGDWFTFKSSFPDGLAPLAEKISSEGLVPGLWLAPFIVDPRSDLFHNHPEWILKKKNGKPVNAGFGWNVLTTGLDLTVPKALDYVCQVVKAASSEWGFPYLKLDFLYAAALKGCFHDPTKTRAQVLRRGMEAIREAVKPEVTLLGCGAPLGSMIGVVDLMRIGADVSGDWVPKFHKIAAFIKEEPAFPCAHNSIRNILTRATMHSQWWINDPDCLLIRPETNLTLEEVQSLATVIGMTGGSLLLSDDLTKLPPDRLRIAQVLLPVIGEHARVLDWFDAEMPEHLRLDQVNESGEWHILARFNWSDDPISVPITLGEFDLPPGDYWVREFWGGSVGQFSTEHPFELKSIPPHGGALLAVRRMQQGLPVYLGSDLHFSQGLEVAQWSPSQTGVQFTLRLPRKDAGNVVLLMPGRVRSVTINNLPGKFIELGDSLIEIPIEVDGFAHISVTLG